MKMSELENRLKKHAIKTKNVMQTPFDLKQVIKNMEAGTMRKPKSIIKRTIAIAAVSALCIISVTMTPLAKGVRGFFKDVVRFDGAITGTQYENATNDIKVNAMESATDNGNNIIPLKMTFENPDQAPFIYIQEIAVADYMVIDGTTGNVLKMECYPEYSARGTVKDGNVLVNLVLGDIELKSDVEYTIIIEKMYGLAKAEAPLHITGMWKCKFVK